MFDNVGGKIMGLAYFLTFLGIFLSVACGNFLIIRYELWGWGIFTIVVGCIGSWISNLCLYGFGKLIENTDILAEDKGNKL